MESNLDLRQLRVLRALLSENSVSKAAEVLGQSQPSVSATLRQLRDTLGDQLLVRSGAGMVRTERAESIADEVDILLNRFEELLDPPGDFDPSQSDRHVRIIAYLGLGSLLIPALIRAFRIQAPHMRLEFLQPQSPDIIKQQLQDGEVDLVIANRLTPFPNLRFAPLIECDIACIMSTAHSLADVKQLTLEQYLALEHLSPSPATLLSGAPIDGRLEELGLQRNISVTVPEYALARYIVPGSNLVFTTARPYAEEMSMSLPVSVAAAPAELGTMNAYCFWHEKNHQAVFGKWLRQSVKRVAHRLFNAPSTHNDISESL